MDLRDFDLITVVEIAETMAERIESLNRSLLARESALECLHAEKRAALNALDRAEREASFNETAMDSGACDLAEKLLDAVEKRGDSYVAHFVCGAISNVFIRRKIVAIKTLRAVTGLGLKEAKESVENWSVEKDAESENQTDRTKGEE